MSYALTFEELMRVCNIDLAGAEIVKCGENDSDNYISVKKGTVQFDVIRRKDGKFINWSQQEI